MDIYVKKLTDSLEPLIIDLDDKIIELRIEKEKFERISRFIAYVDGHVNLVGIYADQNLILENLDNINRNKDEYKASCYLLQNEDLNIKALPQYQEANDFMLKLINYFKMNKLDLANRIQELDNECKEKSLNKKYFELFSKDNPFVTDIKEFENFLDKHTETDEEKVNLLMYAINSNVLHYQGRKS